LHPDPAVEEGFSLRTALFALCLAVAASPATGQKPSEQTPALDRIVQETPGGGPWALTPVLPSFSDMAPLAIGRAAGVPVGFELVPEASSGRVTPGLQAQLKTRERISLGGKTVREALDAFVANDPRYHWVDVHGVPVVRPRQAWVDPANPLNRVVGPIDWQEVRLGTALTLLVEGLTGMPRDNASEVGNRHGHPFSLRLETAGLLEMLNEIALSHGGLMWSVEHECVPPNVKRPAGDDLKMGFTSFEGWGFSGCFVIPAASDPERVAPR
jgi:hypothetical protein